MRPSDREEFDVNQLINGLFEPEFSLRELFSARIDELELSFTAASSLLKMSPRSLNGILDGTQKTTDFINLSKISAFLQITREKTAALYMKALDQNFPQAGSVSTEKKTFIQEHFDLGALKKVGFISDVMDYKQINDKLVSHLGLRSILEYRKPTEDVAFSAGKITPKNPLSRELWISSAKAYFEEIQNPNPYNRKELVEIFPEIRWHSTNVRLGLFNVVRMLYKVGVTVIYLAPLPSLNLRGATFSVNDKPCIVLSDMRGFYPTLWFALVHELFHVLFDWEEISQNRYHVSDPDTDQLTVLDRENEANAFAREYLFSKEKTAFAKRRQFDKEFIHQFTVQNHVHPSFFYVFNAYDVGRRAWGLATKNNPDISEAIDFFHNAWSNPMPIREFVRQKWKKLEH